MTEAPMQPNLANGEWVPYRSYMNKSHLVPVASFPSYNLVVVNNVRLLVPPEVMLHVGRSFAHRVLSRELRSPRSTDASVI